MATYNNILNMYIIIYMQCMYSQDHYTPVYAASAEGFNEVVKFLIAANADVNCVCKVRNYY